MIKMNLGELLGAVIAGSSWFQLWQSIFIFGAFPWPTSGHYIISSDNHRSGKYSLIMN